MKFNLSCSDFNAEDYRGKRLVWYAGETKKLLTLSSSVSVDGTKFALMATVTGLASLGSSSNENQIAVVETQIDEDTLRRMEKPEARFLRPICDYVIFDNSPLTQARLAA